MNWVSKLALPLLAIALGVYGVIRIRQTGGDGDGFLTAGAALVCVGAFLVMEVQSRDKDRKDDDGSPK